MNGPKLKVASLFCGIGGSDLGMIGGFNYLGKHYDELPFEIAYAVDFDKSVIEIYNKNFRHKAVCADVCNEDFSKIPNVDVMIGGFPCQSFSIANRQRNSYDERAMLYKQIVRFLKEKKPTYFICENVKGLLSLDKGEAIKRIVMEFAACGYIVSYKLYNAKDYGIPQQRERVFIFGRNDGGVSNPSPQPLTDIVPLRAVIDPLADRDKKLVFSKRAIEGAKKYIGINKFRRLNARDLDEPCTTITAHLGKVTCNSGDPIICLNKEKETYRRLSIREAGRIQSFPDTFIFHDVTSKALKQIGNAVPPVLMWHYCKSFSEIIPKL